MLDEPQTTTEAPVAETPPEPEAPEATAPPEPPRYTLDELRSQGHDFFKQFPAWNETVKQGLDRRVNEWQQEQQKRAQEQQRLAQLRLEFENLKRTDPAQFAEVLKRPDVAEEYAKAYKNPASSADIEQAVQAKYIDSLNGLMAYLKAHPDYSDVSIDDLFTEGDFSKFLQGLTGRLTDRQIKKMRADMEAEFEAYKRDYAAKVQGTHPEPESPSGVRIGAMAGIPTLAEYNAASSEQRAKWRADGTADRMMEAQR